MSSRISRWNCLTILAIANLVFWVAVAVVVGLATTDRVNLGIETFIREHQATVMAIWKQTAPMASASATRSDPLAAAVEKASGAPAQSPAVTRMLALPLQAPQAAEVEATPQPQPTSSKARTLAPVGHSPTPQAINPAPQPTSSKARPSAPAGNSLAPQPTAIPASLPLLLAEPAFNNLMGLDAEMNRSAVGRAVQIRYGETALNRELASLLASYPDLPYHDLYVQLNRDQVVIRGKVTVMGFDVSTQVSGVVVARDCLPQAQIENISIVGVSTPGFVKKEIEKIILEWLNWYPADYPLCLEQIVVEEGRITIYGFRR